MKNWQVDKSWTLFLDRDGVLNEKLEAAYVRKVAEFTWCNDILTILPKLTDYFAQTVIVTNQQGIGKQLMTTADLQTIFQYMEKKFVAIGAKIDKYYFCPHLAAENCGCRKPSIGMGLQAKKDFPTINFQQSIMIGDSITDMQFGKKLGMKTVFLTNYHPLPNNHQQWIDVHFINLLDFTKSFFR